MKEPSNLIRLPSAAASGLTLTASQECWWPTHLQPARTLSRPAQDELAAAGATLQREQSALPTPVQIGATLAPNVAQQDDNDTRA